jgi:LuxR family maltose regulon positive regulatory protein
MRRGEWQQARLAFENALKERESAEALEGLAQSCHWLNDGATAIDARERAFRLYNEAGDPRSAGRAAIWLAMDYAEFRGEVAIASGWLQRARTLLEQTEPCEERAYLLAFLANDKLLGEKDIEGARKLAAEARAIAQSVNSIDVLMIAKALEGLALVSEGQVREGMRWLDEATLIATGGECKDIGLIGAACCTLISACERVRDYDRAAQWCDHVKEFCVRWKMGSLFATCRTQYSNVLISRGDWPAAEDELIAATEELAERRPPLVRAATVRLAELRRRQGRFDEARKLFSSVESHLLSLLGLAALSLDSDDFGAAIDYAHRYLRRVPPIDRIERVPGLELLVRAYAKTGEMMKAREALVELRSSATYIATDALLGAAQLAEGMVAAAGKDFDAATAYFEDATDLFDRARMPYESVQSRIELAQILDRLGQTSRAQREASTALEQAERIGAGWLAIHAAELLPSVRLQPSEVSTQVETALSGREKEILRLVAQGKDNNGIADELFLSVRTVERHISNAYQKLGITGKSARVAAAAYAMRNLTPLSSSESELR